jgi:DNA mismatch endonuclease (patch repair protein)
MADTLTPAERSQRMALVKAKNTKPELTVRKLVYGLGYRYRLHVRDLPGRPDIVFRRLGKVIFVHGCFWHRHAATGCKLARLPKSRVTFWSEKLEGNHQRDLANIRSLRKEGWKVLQIWECQLTNIAKLEQRIALFLR